MLHAKAGVLARRVASTCVERVLGTVMGGITGFVVYCVSKRLDTLDTLLLLGITAGGVGMLSVWGGHLLRLNYSAKLFTLTFLLVFAGADDVVRASPALEPSGCIVCEGKWLGPVWRMCGPDTTGFTEAFMMMDVHAGGHAAPGLFLRLVLVSVFL